MGFDTLLHLLPSDQILLERATHGSRVWRYLLCMKYFEIFALNFFLLSTAGATPVPVRGEPGGPPPEQRRTELRSSLRDRRLPVSGQSTESSGQTRRLSDQERADLRHQLRRQS